MRTGRKASRFLKAFFQMTPLTLLFLSLQIGILFFLSGNSKNGVWSGPGISKFERTATGYTTPEGLIIEGFDTRANAANTVSSDQRYIISRLENSESRGTDLFVFFRKEDGSYGNRLNLGSTINTAGSETSPFLAADNKTLYFGSDGHLGYGNSDIFMSRRLDDSWTNWSEPENLDPKVNSQAWDAYYSVSAKGDYAYMTTYWQTEGEADIIRIK